jgi:16S rRNA (uracil1498-N3)-methyltransferase
VSAPLFLVDQLPAAGSFVLEGPEGHHAATVQRVRVGERLMLGDGRGARAMAEVVSVDRGRVDLALNEPEFAPAADPRLVVVQGIPKGDRGELAVQAMTEVGVDEIVPWAAARSVTQWRAERGHRARGRWVATAREAAKQSRRAWLPQVGGDPDVSTKLVAERLRGAAAAYVLHEAADQRLSAVPLPDSGDIVLVIGPEGGIDDRELAAFDPAVPVRLGAEVLRTSTAGVAAVAVLATRLGRW